VQAADLINWQGDRAHDGLRQLINDIIAISSEPSGSKESRDQLPRALAEKISARKPRPKSWLPYLLAVGAVATPALGMGYFTYEQQDGHRLISREENAASADLDGIYQAAGKNPDGTLYTAEVVIRRENAVYYITWKIGKQTLFGSGTLNKNILNIRWGSGDLVSYVVQTNGILQGSWANGQGTETLTPYGSSKRDEGR
jgi:hypothetical protein